VVAGTACGALGQPPAAQDPGMVPTVGVLITGGMAGAGCAHDRPHWWGGAAGRQGLGGGCSGLRDRGGRWLWWRWWTGEGRGCGPA